MHRSSPQYITVNALAYEGIVADLPPGAWQVVRYDVAA